MVVETKNAEVRQGFWKRNEWITVIRGKALYHC